VGYQSRWAASHFPTRRDRNAFFTKAGRALAPGAGTLVELRALGNNPEPEDILRVRV
jgi:hypothetical protein